MALESVPPYLRFGRVTGELFAIHFCCPANNLGGAGICATNELERAIRRLPSWSRGNHSESYGVGSGNMVGEANQDRARLPSVRTNPVAGATLTQTPYENVWNAAGQVGFCFDSSWPSRFVHLIDVIRLQSTTPTLFSIQPPRRLCPICMS